MTRNRETVDIEILIEDMTGIPDGWSSIEAFIKGGEGYPAYDITNNEVIGKIGKAIIEDGVVKGVIAKIYVDCIPTNMQNLRVGIKRNE